MKRVPVTDLKNRLSEFLRLVKRGETIEIVERSIPIARIEGVRAADERGAESFEQLVREGEISRPKARLDPAFFAAPPLACEGDAVRVLIEERGEG
jgi:prevent-host-death family protein